MGEGRSSAVCGFPAPIGSGRAGRMQPVLSIAGLGKTYKSGHEALSGVDLTIDKGEVFALLVPNGDGQTTLISIVRRLVTPRAATVTVAGHAPFPRSRPARALIGAVKRTR